MSLTDRFQPESPSSPGEGSDLGSFGFDLPEAEWLSKLRAADRPRVLGRAGGYELLEEIGHGAQGIVFRARQPNTKREVALKRLVAGSFATPAMRLRFEREVEAAASLHHPNIVTVYGVENLDGQPVLAMEWVDGVPVDRWSPECGVRGAEWSADADRKLLELFVKICDAVQHAHQRGVIHRDLKPTNILVDAAGEPRVLDFGLAKISRADGSSPAAGILTHDFVGTPAYAAPEQLRGQRDQVDVRGDVYALGVILYQLLTGRLPHNADRSLAEWVTAVEHARPELPSSVNPALGRELDAIVLKALEAEPDRRYSSVEALKADLERYQAGEAVLAHPPSVAYLFSKWVSRHRLAFAFAVTVSVLLAAFAMTATVLAVRLASQRAAAEAARDRETAARQTAEQINRFLRDMLASPDPAREGPAATVRNVLDAAAGNLAAGAFEDQPAIEAELRGSLGNAYRAMGLFSEAESHLLRSAELRRKIFGADPTTGVELAQGLNDLATLRHEQADRAAAEPLYEESLGLRRVALGERHPLIGESLNNLAQVFFARGDYAAAEPLLQEAVDILREAPGDNRARLAVCLDNLGRLFQARGDLVGAEAPLREALELRRGLYGPDHFDVAKALTSVGLLLRAKGDTASAEPLLADALIVFRKVLGPDHPELAPALGNLALLLQTKGELAEAEPLLREALAIRRQRLGDEHPEVAQSLNNLGGVVKARGDLDAAESYYREALAIYERNFAHGHPHAAMTLNNLAAVAYARADYAGAEELYRQVLAFRRRTLDAAHPDLAISLNNLGLVLVDRGELTEAVVLLREALAIQREKLPAAHPHLASTVVNLGAALLELGEPAEAEPMLREGLDIRRTHFPEEHWLVAHPKTMLGTCLAARGAFGEAEMLLLAGHQAMQGDPQAPEKRKRAALERIARLYDAWGKPELAADWRGRR